ncbi:MAG: hypothetical protein AB7I30_24285 [Isosphaeraceae bacterium]
MTRRLWIGLLCGGFAGTLSFGQEPAPREPARALGTPHALLVDAKVKVTRPDGGEVEVGAVARVEYRFDRKADAAEVGIDKLGLKIVQDGRSVQDSTLSREAFQARPGPGAPVVAIPYEKAPPALQEMLGVFGTTVARVKLDPADGRETTREFLVDGPLAQTFKGLVESILSIHASVPEDADDWESPARLALAQGQSAQGALKFEKTGPAKDGLVTVKVGGTLTADGSIGAAKVKGGTYVVTGEQVYDVKANAWRSARWSVDMNYTLTDPDDKPTGVARGPLTLTMGTPTDVPESNEAPKPTEPVDPK